MAIAMPPDFSDSTSPSLIRRAQADDNDAWSQLVQLYGPLVAHWCRQGGMNEHDTADIFQETFRAVAGHLSKFTHHENSGSFRRWLRTIARTKLIDHVRRLSRQSQARGGTTAQAQLSCLTDSTDDQDDADGESEHALLVQRALELIESEYQPQNWAAFRQVTIEGRSATEVAEEMGVHPQVVRQVNYRIRRRLRTMLAGELPQNSPD